MEKLELKHIAPYLHYGLKGRVDKESYLQEERERIGELKTIDLADHNYELAVYGDLGYFLCDISDFKPILRPLSDLTNEIEHNGEKFIPLDELTEGSTVRFSLPDYSEDWDSRTYYSFGKYIEEWINGDVHHLNFIPFGFIQKLYEWHFDIYGLIEKGMAIDINTLNQEK